MAEGGGLPANQTVNGFAVASDHPRLMYVVTREGLFKSTDGGETWRSLARGLRDLAAVAINPRRPDEVYVATANGVISKSAGRAASGARAASSRGSGLDSRTRG